MMKIKRILPVIIFLAIIMKSLCSGAVGTGGAEFMKIVPGTRSAGMGGSGMALGLMADSIYLNPAALYTTKKKKQILFSHLTWWESVGYEYFAYVHGLGKLGVLGASFTWLHMPEVELTNLYGTKTGDTIAVYDMMLNLSYAGKLFRGMSWGMNVKSIRRQLGYNGSNAFAGDIGCLYKIRLGSAGRYSILSFAAAVQNALGTGIYFLDSNYTDSFPVIVKLGTAYRPSSKVSLAFDVDMLSDKRIKYHAGAEYWLSKEFGVRAGYENMDDLGAFSGLCFGLSIKPDLPMEYITGSARKKRHYMFVQMDYAVRLSGDMGTVHRFAMRMNLRSSKKKMRRAK